MHHNDVQYWRYLQSLAPGHEDLPSPRVCRLLFKTFGGWKSRPGWVTEAQIGHLFRNRADLNDAERAKLAAKPIVVRKALAIKRMLELVVSPDVARTAASTSIVADELILGTMPPFSVGQGKEFVRYLTEAEELAGALDYLNELSPMGHIIPNHAVVIERGLAGVAEDAREAARAAGRSEAQRNFYEAVAISLDAVIAYAAHYAGLARALAKTLPDVDPNKQSLERTAANLAVVPAKPATTFHQALQAIYIVHCALHWTVEIVPIGRLDQLLARLHDDDIKSGALTPERAQELIDCFWIKLDERVILNFRHAENRFTASDGVMTGSMSSANYDQGALLNQWMQQITIGGVLPNDVSAPVDACNAVTRLCLAAARRLPLNSPTLDLRVHNGTPADVIELAAKALMSGGAHPVLLNDDIIVAALTQNSGASIPLKDARNYACDGCFETMVAGESEFSFGFVSALDLIEKTLNRGAGIDAAGAIDLRGSKDSWRTKFARDIADFDEFKSILRRHMEFYCHRYLKNLTTFYGDKEQISPSPLLSALITGCLEKGRDLTAGGAKYHIFSPLLVGVSNAADSLYVIDSLVFGKKAFSLEELTACLVTDWGNRYLGINGKEVVAFGKHIDKARVDEIRALCLGAFKFGTGRNEVDEMAWWLLRSFAECVQGTLTHPLHAAGLASLDQSYGSPKFVIHLAPGVGTFEQYVFSGTFNSASPDGRRGRAPIASDLSPAPLPNDQPVSGSRRRQLDDSLRSYHSDVMRSFGDGAPVDYNIPEEFPVEKLAQFVKRFADGEGGSICTFTVADAETFAAAQRDPDNYNLVRVRMGGWTEFFVTLFPDHQEQHKRRPHYA